MYDLDLPLITGCVGKMNIKVELQKSCCLNCPKSIRNLEMIYNTLCFMVWSVNFTNNHSMAVINIATVSILSQVFLFDCSLWSSNVNTDVNTMFTFCLIIKYYSEISQARTVNFLAMLNHFLFIMSWMIIESFLYSCGEKQTTAHNPITECVAPGSTQYLLWICCSTCIMYSCKLTTKFIGACSNWLKIANGLAVSFNVL